jgi:hypothetical protein
MNARERTYATPLVAIRANATIAPTVSSGPVVGSFSASVVVSEFALDEGVSVVEGVSAWFDVSLSAESSLEDDVSLGSRVTVSPPLFASPLSWESPDSELSGTVIGGV